MQASYGEATAGGRAGHRATAGWPWPATMVRATVRTSRANSAVPSSRRRTSFGTSSEYGPAGRWSSSSGSGRPPYPGSERADRAAWMRPRGVAGSVRGCVAQLDEVEPVVRELGQLVERRVGAEEVEGVDEDPGVGLVDRPDDGGGRGEVPGGAPRGELEVDREAVVERELAEAAEVVGGPGPVGIGELADDVPGADRGGGLEDLHEPVGLVVGADPRQLDVEHPHARVGQAVHDLAHHRRVARQRGDLLARCDRRGPDADVVVAGRRRDVDELERRRPEHREVGERELGAHGHAPSCRSTSRGGVP